MNSIRRLAETLAREDVVVFVGSGVSMWSGYPSWDGLISELIVELDALGRTSTAVERARVSGDLLTAASYGVDQLSTQERQAFFRRVIDPSRTPSDLHRAIANLGPRCFVTTNYDQLLERTLLEGGEFVDVVTPVHTLEIPSIVQSRAKNFVFKPHGDISASETIVFTREDYRDLLGKRRGVFEAVQMLFASRPVVFIGFGLRDPDFLQLRDELFNSFQTNPADHFAIMADVLEEERSYWVKHYGIELISYDIENGSTGESSHRQLLHLISEVKRLIDERAGFTEGAALTLARYAQGFKVASQGVSDDVPLRLMSAKSTDLEGWRRGVPYHSDAVAFLTSCEGHVFIEGPPGSGKSHVIQRVVAELAGQLLEYCLSTGTFELKKARVPVFVQLRDYRGDLRTMVAEALPVGLVLERMLAAKCLVVFLDGLNEAPSASEDLLLKDIEQFLASSDGSTVILTSRSTDQVRHLAARKLVLDAVAESAIADQLASAGWSRRDFSPVVLDLMRRPLYFRSWLRGALDITSVTSIHDVYLQLLNEFDLAASEHFGIPIDVAREMGAIAFRMIDIGGLTLGRDEVIELLAKALPDQVPATRFFDLVLERGLLVATSTRRVAFYHHSVTEYVAAHHLADQLVRDAYSCMDLLNRTEWDHALLLSLGFMEESVAPLVHQRILQVDPFLGLRALYFVDHEQDVWLKRTLALLPEILADTVLAEWQIPLSLGSFDINEMHVPELRALVRIGGLVGGHAMGMLARTRQSFLHASIDEIVDGAKGYNYLTELGRQLAPQLDSASQRKLLLRLSEKVLNSQQAERVLAVEEDQLLLPVVSAASDALSGIKDDLLLEVVEELNSPLVLAVGLQVLRDRNSAAAIDFVRQQILDGVEVAVVAHYFQLAFRVRIDVRLPAVSEAVVESLLASLVSADVGPWALRLLRMLSARDPLVAELLRNSTEQSLVGAIRRYAAGDDQGFRQLLLALVAQSPSWSPDLVGVLRGVEKWDSEVVLALLRTRNNSLAAVVLDALREDYTWQVSLGKRELESWVDWLGSAAGDDWVLVHGLGRFLARRTSEETRQQLILLFCERPDLRSLLDLHVLRGMPGLSLTDFTCDAIDWMVEDAMCPSTGFGASTLARIATEPLVEERLLPLHASSSGVERRSISEVLIEIGRRLDRRFVAANGDEIR